VDLYRAIGSRRSIRYYQSWRPVETGKIQRMLEAARLAPHGGNIGAVRAVVVDNQVPRPAVQKAFSGPGSAVHAAMAPLLLVWYLDLQARDDLVERLKELIAVGALNPSHGWSDQFAEEYAGRILDRVNDGLDMASTTELVDAGQAIAQATLTAVAEGLGSCLVACDGPALKAALGLPERSVVLVAQTVGYSAESPAAGGQRPRRAFETLFALNNHETPFPRDPETVAALQDVGMLQEPAKLAWRDAEVRALSHLGGLPV
jgi:nitroreductase